MNSSTRDEEDKPAEDLHPTIDEADAAIEAAYYADFYAAQDYGNWVEQQAPEMDEPTDEEWNMRAEDALNLARVQRGILYL